jgi:septum formation protein
MRTLILASQSEVRLSLLRRAGLVVEPVAARVDEEALREGLQAEGAGPRDLSDALAEHKAQKVAARRPDALVLGCDQVLDLDGVALGKPADRDAARARLLQLRGRTHRLWSAAVLYDRGQPVWRHIAEARLTMRDFTDGWLESYLDQAGWALTGTTGGYAIEEMGVRLFQRIEGDQFGILGLPLVELLVALTRRGDIPG